MERMKAYATFDEFTKDQTADHQAILRALRRFVHRVEPGLSETVRWGNGCWVGQGGPVAYAHCRPDDVQFGFFHGYALEDPNGLLAGKGRYVRFIALRSASEIDEPAFAALLRQAHRSASAFHAAASSARSKGGASPRGAAPRTPSPAPDRRRGSPPRG